MGSSPHTRGALVAPHRRHDRRRIIPAYAGSTACRRRSSSGTWDHPRIRGEHNANNINWATYYGSSPHTRGARALSRIEACGNGIIPAYAGSTARGAWGGVCRADHPRIRGEHRPPEPWYLASEGSSPHTRGAPNTAHTRERIARIIPAYAGSTWVAACQALRIEDHPRIRGEHSLVMRSCCLGSGSSPHTRGAPQSCR